MSTAYNAKDWKVSADEYTKTHTLIINNTPQVSTKSIQNLEVMIFNNLKKTINDKVAKAFRDFVQKKQNNKASNDKDLFVFYDLGNPSKSKILKHLKNNFNDISPNEIDQTVLLFLAPIIKGIALSKKERMGREIVNGFVDTYSFYFIDHVWRHSQSNIDLELKAKVFIKQLNISDNPNIDNEGAKLIEYIIKDYYGRFMGSFPSSQPSYLIDDDINQFASFITNMNKSLNRDENDNKDNVDQHWLSKMYPIQIDVWVIPRNTVKNPHKIMENEYESADESDDDDPDYLAQINKDANSKSNEEKTDITHENIGDIVKRLKSQKIKYYSAKIEEDIRWSKKEINKHFAKYMNGKFERYGRYIVILDRRKKTYNTHNYNILYIFKAKDLKPIQKAEFDYFYQYQSFYLSKECLIPQNIKQKVNGRNGRNAAIGSNDIESGYMFCQSYHLYNENFARIYLYADGFPLRYYQKDIALIWPKYFIKDKKTNKEQQIYMHLINRLPAFRDDKYKEFCSYFGINSKIVQNSFMKSQPKMPMTLQETLQIKSQEKIPMKLQEEMKLKLDSTFPDELPGKVFMNILEDEGYKTENVIEDIEEEEDSDIISQLIEKTTGLTEDQHGTQIIQILMDVIKNHNKINNENHATFK